jgi:hypothetical protein
MAREIRSGRLALRPGADPQAWDQLVTAHPDATPFHLSTFLTTAGRLLGLDAHLAVAEVDGQVVGVVPLLVRSRGPFALVNHHLPFPYLGPLLRPECSLESVLDAVRRYLAPRTVLYLGLESVAPLSVPGRPGWQGDDTYTSAFARVAEDTDAQLALMASTRRRSVRRSLRENVVTGPATRQELADHLEAWVGETFARQGLAPRWPAGAMVAIHDALAPTGGSVIHAARRDGEVLSVTLDLLGAGRMIGWQIGTGAAGRALGAHGVLHLELARTARERGIAEIDLLGAPSESMASYKRSLGAEFRPRGSTRWSPPLVPWARRVLRRTPPVLAAVTR